MMNGPDPIRYQVVSGEIVESLMPEIVLLRLRIRPYDAEGDPAPTFEESLELILDLSLAGRLAEVLAYLSGMTFHPPDFEIEGEHQF